LLTFAVAEPAQQAVSGQQIGQQPPSGQHASAEQQESLVTCVLAVPAQHASSGQHALSGQHADGSVEMIRAVDRLYAATLPVTSRARASTLLAMIFVRIIVLQIIRSVVKRTAPWSRKAHASRRPAQQATGPSLNVVQEFSTICASARIH
jgi:hypothetical protein